VNNLANLMRGQNNNYGTPDRVQPQNPMNQNAAQVPQQTFGFGQMNQPQGAFGQSQPWGNGLSQMGQRQPVQNHQYNPGARIDAWRQEHQGRDWQGGWNPPQFGGGGYFDGDLGKPGWWNKPNGGW
jgi:hypothetical protein